MRVDASATAITWLPFEALDRLKAVPLELAVAHYDEPPPEVVPDLHELRLRDAFREANELTAWIEVDGGEIVDYGQTGRSLAGEGPELETRQLAFAAVEFLKIENVLIKPDRLLDVIDFDRDMIASINLHAHVPT